MGKRKKQIDRRKRGRSELQSAAFVVFRPDFGKMGHIVDISMEGLTFRYIPDEEPLKESTEVDILLADDSFRLSKLPVETISDVEFDEGVPLTSVAMRRRGVQFGPLSDRQRSQLRIFIGRYAHPAPR